MNTAELIKIGLPVNCINALTSRGIEKLEPLQVEAIGKGLFNGKDIIVMAPTSSGKTLVGELAALFHVINRNGAVILTSHKALAYEKYLTFRESYSQDKYFFATPPLLQVMKSLRRQ